MALMKNIRLRLLSYLVYPQLHLSKHTHYGTQQPSQCYCNSVGLRQQVISFAQSRTDYYRYAHVKSICAMITNRKHIFSKLGVTACSSSRFANSNDSVI